MISSDLGAMMGVMVVLYAYGTCVVCMQCLKTCGHALFSSRGRRVHWRFWGMQKSFEFV